MTNKISNHNKCFLKVMKKATALCELVLETKETKMDLVV